MCQAHGFVRKVRTFSEDSGRREGGIFKNAW
jgi:hypothetical protein